MKCIKTLKFVFRVFTMEKLGGLIVLNERRRVWSYKWKSILNVHEWFRSGIDL